MVVVLILFEPSVKSPGFLFYLVLFLGSPIVSILHGFATYLRDCATHAFSLKISLEPMALSTWQVVELLGWGVGQSY